MASALWAGARAAATVRLRALSCHRRERLPRLRLEPSRPALDGRKPAALAGAAAIVWNAALYPVLNSLKGFQDLAWFSVRTVAACFRRPFYARDLYEQLYHGGVGSLPVVLVASFFAGQALALQFSRQLAETGSQTLLGTLMTIAIVRALGPDLIGLVVSARLSAGYTAEIGSMKSSDQIDALTAFGTNPLSKLAVPRLISLVVMLPVLTFIGDAVSIASGSLMAKYVAHVSLSLYWSQIEKGMVYGTILIGSLKPLAFALIIAFVGCWKGFTSSGGTKGVGRATTESVVISAVLILIVDFLMTRVIFSILDW
jgi:phospholipid/cholesterol/gamma-HCH transport system permease protein